MYDDELVENKVDSVFTTRVIRSAGAVLYQDGITTNTQNNSLQRTYRVGKRNKSARTNRGKVSNMNDKLPFSPISDTRIDDAVIQYSREYETNMTIKWGSIERRLAGASKVDLELAYRRTLRRYEVVEEHNYHSATVFLIPKHLHAKLVTIEPSTLARVLRIAKSIQRSK